LIGMLLGLAVLALARAHPDGSLAGRSVAGALALLGAGWGLVAAGVVAWRRWPQSRFGALLAAAGLAWMLAELPNPEVGSALLFTVGLVTFAVAPPLVAHAALAYPGGHIDRTSERAALAAGYASTIGVLGLLHALVFDPHADGCNFCPANLLTVDAGGAAADFVERGGLVFGVVSSAGMIVVLGLAIAHSTPAARRTRAPVLVAAIAYLGLVAAGYAYSLQHGLLSTGDVDRALWRAQALALVVVALGPLARRVRARHGRLAVTRLAVEFGEAPPLGRLRDVLARAVGDPALELAFPAGDDRYVDPSGRPVRPAPGDGVALTPLLRGSRTVAVLMHHAGLLDDPALVEELSAAARLSLEHERLQAEARGQLEELRVSRAGAVQAGDRERRRLERDLHDGAQQRLVGIALALRLLRAGISPSGAPHLDAAGEHLSLALAELRELARGIYPAALAEEGLAAALEALAESAPVPVVLEGVAEERLPEAVEAAAYFLVAHTLRQAAVTRLAVHARRHDEWLVLELAAGGPLAPDFAAAEDRVGALEGSLVVERTEDGLTIRAEMPCAS
jgi:signal transduction histidine kinase